MRVLANDVSKLINKYAFYDSISDMDLVLFYKAPTTTDVVNYYSKLVEVVESGKKDASEFKIKAGLELITGIEENIFCDENGKPISSKLESKNYFENWKQLLEKNVPVLLLNFAYEVFERSGRTKLPLAKSSGAGSINALRNEGKPALKTTHTVKKDLK